jgi:hypothetical protein
MRFVPLMLGTLAVALTFATARKLVHPSCGFVAALFLVFWSWTSPGNRMLGTGIPFTDVSRVARYDVLTAPLGLAALLSFVEARYTGQLKYDFLTGLFAGLTGLAQSYGLFWGAALLLMLVFDRTLFSSTLFSKRPIHSSLLGIVAGIAVVWLPWIVFIASHWSDFVNQQSAYPERFDVLNPLFYLNNLLNEPRRYLYGPSSFTKISLWLVLGIPATLAWLAVRVAHRCDRRELWLLVPCVMMPLLFALLLQPKVAFYLPSIAVLFAILIAWLITQLMSARWRIVRLGILVAVVLTLGQGVVSVAFMQSAAARTIPPKHFLERLQQAIPSSARVLGRPLYWLALPYPTFRSFALPFYMSDPDRNRAPISFEAALGNIAPDIVLLDAAMAGTFADHSTSDRHARSEQFWAYMRHHNAQLQQVLNDNYGEPIQIYRLDQPE